MTYKSVKMVDFALLESSKLISRKIWRTEKSWNFATHLFLQCCQLNCLFFLFSGASMLSHILSSLFRKGTGSPRPSELPTMSPWHALRKRGCGRPPFWLRHHWSHGNCQWVVHGRRDWFWRHFLYWLQEPWVCFSPGSMLNLRQFLVLKLCHGSQGNFFFSESPPNSKIDNFGLIYVHTDLGSLL